MVVIGYERSKGTYQGFDYDNTKVYCVEAMKDGPDRDGEKAFILKVKTSAFVASGVRVGDSILCNYDRFGNVISVVKE